ncbi:hypothetical protein EIP86_005510, partial [Pleurotus ostreatoroseus]
MRALLRFVVVLILLVWMVLTCSACKEHFESSHGLTQHRRSCGPFKSRTHRLSQAYRQGYEEPKRPESGSQSNVKAKIPRIEHSEPQNIRGILRNRLHTNSELSHTKSASSPVAGPSATPAAPSGTHSGAFTYPSTSFHSESPTTLRNLPPTRSGRARRAPKRFQDVVPSLQANDAWNKPLEHLIPTPSPQPEVQKPQEASQEPTSPEEVDMHFDTVPNIFNVFRRYARQPARNLNDHEPPDNGIDSPTIRTPHSSPPVCSNPFLAFGRNAAATVAKWFSPLSNATSFRLFNWQYDGGTTKSDAAMRSLVKDVFNAPDFNLEDAQNFEPSRESRRLDEGRLSTDMLSASGFTEGSVTLSLPKTWHKFASEDAAPKVKIPGIWFRRLLSMLREEAQGPSARSFEWNGYTLLHRDSETGREERLFSEILNSNAFLDEEKKIRNLPRNPEDPPNVERVIGPICPYSDETRTAQFGGSSLWPFYIFFPWISKYMNGKVGSFTAHHLAYIPKLPEILKHEYISHYGKPPSSEVLRFCKSELIQAIWLLILDDEFMEAYEHGILKGQICQLGTKNDGKRRENIRQDDQEVQDKVNAARKNIFLRGFSLVSQRVESLLKSTSLLPTRSAFSIRFSKFKFNFYSLFTFDLLHGFESGAWKDVFSHLIRLLDAKDKALVVTLNDRFRQVPTFGRGTIRRFGTNVAGQKQFAARDYEDVLQCVIPCIEGLLDPKLEHIVMDLLWFMLMWHALAKLRLHTQTTVSLLEGITTDLGRAVRKFARSVEDIETYELPKEHAARKRREAAQSQATGSAATSTFLGRKIKKFSLSTFKWHDLGHLVRDILNFGTSDVYSTQAGESEHRRIKKLYTGTNKKNVEKQIATKQQRQVTLKKIKEGDEVAIQARKEAASNTATFTAQGDRKRGRPRKAHVFGLDANEQEDLPAIEYTARYQISGSQSHWEDIRRLAAKDPEDPALESFIPNLKDHLLSRLRGDTFDGEEHKFTLKDRRQLSIVGNRIYKHKTLRVNYTTYDMRRSQDSINPRTHADIMVLNPGEDRLSHPYWYGRVCGIFHTNVAYTGSGSTTNTVRRIDFLWVRWFGPEPGARNNRSPFKTRRLPRVGFVPADVSGAFSFLDPTLVIRGVHLIPAFAHGRITSLMGPSILHQAKEKDMDVGDEDPDPDSDWERYYVNIFVDRDMIMRYLGGGIGHILLRGVINVLEVARIILGRHDEADDVREEDTAMDIDDREKPEDANEDEEAYIEQLFDEEDLDDVTAAELLEDREDEDVEED